MGNQTISVTQVPSKNENISRSVYLKLKTLQKRKCELIVSIVSVFLGRWSDLNGINYLRIAYIGDWGVPPTCPCRRHKTVFSIWANNVETTGDFRVETIVKPSNKHIRPHFTVHVIATFIEVNLEYYDH